MVGKIIAKVCLEVLRIFSILVERRKNYHIVVKHPLESREAVLGGAGKKSNLIVLGIGGDAGGDLRGVLGQFQSIPG